ncbi:MAG: Lrp/AsnC family transcriptional regulator [Sporomusa sp.]
MDRTDYRILNILQLDCRATLKCIGDQVGLTAPAVLERVHKMEKKGIISNFKISVNRDKLDFNISGFIFVASTAKNYSKFCDFCRNHPSIIQHHHTVGVYNALLRFSVHNARELDELLTAIKNYGDSRTSVELKTYFDSKDIPLPEK